MYDIEVIDGRSYAIIAEDTPAYDFLKAMNASLMMKKLASEAGSETFLTASEIAVLCKGFKRKDLRRLIDVGLLDYNLKRDFDLSSTTYSSYEKYSFTEYGLDVVKFLKENGGDVEIRLN